MRHIIAIILVFSSALCVYAQKVIEKRVPLSHNSTVNLNIQFADSIIIRTWNKDEVYLMTTSNLDNNKSNKYYQWDFEEVNGNLNIKAKMVYSKELPDSLRYIKNLKVYCTLYIPANTRLNAETINGNIKILGRIADVRAKSISGFVDLTISPQTTAQLKLRTITGKIYSDVDLDSPEKKIRQVGGTVINKTLNGSGSNVIHLETISGNIFLRKT